MHGEQPARYVEPHQCNDAWQEKITSLVTKVIVSNMLPLSLAANDHVRTLLPPATAEPNPTDITARSSSTDDDQPPAKRPKIDSRTASLRFLAKSVPQPPPQSDFEQYLTTTAETDIDAMSWWASNAVNYPATASLASQYLSVPATSAQSERQFSAAGRLITKLRARLDGDRATRWFFLYKNM